MKKIKFPRLIIPTFVIALSFFIPLIKPSTAFGADGDILFEGRTDCPTILGMTSWDCNATITDDQNSLRTGIWTIAANVATDITILASYLALGYVIYGGYLYTFSSNEPSRAAAGKKTLVQAFIGLAVAMSATAIMSTIRLVLVGSGNLADCVTESCVTPEQLFIDTLHWALAVAGVVSAIFIVYGGILYSTSAGSSEKTKRAKTIITNALIGLAIVLLAEIITSIVSSTIRKANQEPSSQSNNTHILSEVSHA